jgi:hypothetical protein
MTQMDTWLDHGAYPTPLLAEAVDAASVETITFEAGTAAP